MSIESKLEQHLNEAIESHNALVEQREQLNQAILISTGKVMQLQDLISGLQEESESGDVTGDDDDSV